MDFKAAGNFQFLKHRLLTKTLLIMNLITILTVVACLHVSAGGYAQKITLHEKDVSLEKIFKEIKGQTGYGFIYNYDWLQETGKVSISVTDAPINEVLDLCFQNQPLTYEIVGNIISLRKRNKSFGGDSLIDLHNKLTEIKGRVTNSHGEPIANANVTIKRDEHGTITNADGRFSLNNVRADDQIIISFIGYKTQTIKVGDRMDFTIVLDVTTNDLDKVVVQAYGTTSQRLATGNIGTVTAEQIAKQPVMNVLEALQGQVAGVVVTNTSGYASGTIKVEIRGRNTINPNFPSDPLYIIDGVPLTILDLTGQSNAGTGSQGVIQSGLGSPANGQSPFFSINPSDIESVTVLKDADATAIYGSRGSNGVILITTKKGKAGKTHFDLNVYRGISQVPGYYNMLNTQQYVAMRKEALANDGLPVDINNAADLVVWDTTRYTNWQKNLWGNLGRTTDVEASLSGGDARTTFRIGTGYHYQTEILTSSGANQRGSLSFNINHKSLNQRLNFGLTGTYTLVSSNMIFVPGGINLPPNSPPIWDSKGNLNYAGWSPLDGSFPGAPLLQPYSTKSNLLNSNMVLSYELLKGWVLRANLGYNNILTNQNYITPIASQDPVYNPTGTSYFGSTLIHTLIVEPQMEYDRFIGKGKLNILAGVSYQSTAATSDYLIGRGYNNDALLTSVGNAPAQTANNSLAEYKYEAVFGRINYNWENKYILNLNARRDGSTRFGPGRQFGNFGSAGMAWIFSEEKLVKSMLPFLSLGKIRSSYGTTGNDQIGSYAYLSQWSYNRFTYNNTLPLTPLGHTDSTLHWEVNRKLEAALDLGFWNDRINIEAAWYSNRCNDQLVQFPTPAFSGFTYVNSNSPADVQNTGWEFLLNAKVFDKQNFIWSAKFNMGINRNKLIAYPNLSQSPYQELLVVGQSINLIKLLHNTGVNPQTGLYTFQDKNKDGQITIDQTGQSVDDRYVHDLNPKFDGGFTNTFSYKNWELSVFFYFKKQIGRNIHASLDFPGDNTNQPVDVLNRWQKPGDITSTARFTTNPYSDNSYIDYLLYSDAVLMDASFIRLQNLSLTYALPAEWLKKSGIGNFRIYVRGQNLFIITKYKGLDPEVQNFGTPPLARIITAGISCNF